MTNNKKFVRDSTIILVLLGLALWFLYYLLKLRKLAKSVEKIPGPKTWPLVGNAHLFIGTDSDLATQIQKLSAKYPNLGKGWLGDKLIFFVTKPEYIEIILNSQHALAKSDSYEFAKFFMGKGLGTADVEEWRKNRKIIQPTFNKKLIDRYVGEIDVHSKILTQILRTMCHNGNDADVERHVTNFSVDAFVATILGMPETCAQQSNANYARLFEKLSEISFTRMCKFWLHFQPIYRFSKLYREQKECEQQLRIIMDNLIAKKRAQLSQIENFDDFKPFPDEILRKNLKCQMSDQQFRDEFYTFFNAGTDTNAKTLSFVFLMLALFPQVQERVFQEAVDVLNGESHITLEHLNRFKYIECVIKETLRMIPIFPIMGRRTSAPIDLGDAVIPPDSQVFIIVQNVHKRADYWSDPLEFKPERFQSENINENRHHPYAWLPFSAGPRNCIGFKFAMMLMKICVVEVIKELKISSRCHSKLEDVEFVVNLTMKCKKQLRLYFEQRKL